MIETRPLVQLVAGEGVEVEFEVVVPEADIIGANVDAQGDAMHPFTDEIVVIKTATAQLRDAMERPATDGTSFAAILAHELEADEDLADGAAIAEVARSMGPQPRVPIHAPGEPAARFPPQRRAA